MTVLADTQLAFRRRIASVGESAPDRRGWCPGVRRLMATGDGLLARIHPPSGHLTAAQARGLAKAAAACGNGIIEVTGRGNLQLRGIREDARVEFAGRVESLGLLEPETAGPHRLTVTSPLAGIDTADHIDAAALAEAVEEACRNIAGVPIKAAVAIDGGGCIPLDRIEADIRVLANRHGLVSVGLAGPEGSQWIGATDLSSVPTIIRDLLASLAAIAHVSGGTIRRMRDLTADTRGRLAAAVGRLDPATPLSPDRPAAPRAGLVGTHAGRPALLIGLPFGQCGAAQLAALGELAGIDGVRLSFTRGILMVLRDAADLRSARAEIGRLGLSVEPGDPRLSVSSCPGKPACASGWAPIGQDANRLAVAARAMIAGGGTLHLSGCPKGCARPGPADLTLVGSPEGGYSVVLGGTARDETGLRLPVQAIESRLAAMTALDDLEAAFEGPS